MRILIIANFVDNFDTSRFTDLAKMLAQSHEVELITSDFAHMKKGKKDKPDVTGYKLTFIHESGYKKNISLKRFISHAKFGKNVKKYLAFIQPPDLIYCAVPSLECCYYAAKYAKKHDIPYVIDVQDLWPEAFQMVFRVPILSTLLFAPFKRKANYIYKSADEIIAVSDTYCRRVLQVNKKTTQSLSVFLGTYLSVFDTNARENAVEKQDPSEFWLAYCGTLGSSYDLRCAMDAIALLQSKGVENIRFKVMGDGPLRSTFEAYAAEKKINAEFFGYMPYPKMCGLLSACDVAINPITHGSAASIINKHGDYAAAGIPVINTQESAEYRSLVESYQMGYNCANGDAEDMASKIELLLKDENLRKSLGEGARKCAEERFDRNRSYKRIVEVLEKYEKPTK